MDANEAKCECDAVKCLELCRCKTHDPTAATLAEFNKCNCDAVKCLEQCSCNKTHGITNTVSVAEYNRCSCDAIKCLEQCSCKTHDVKISTQDYVKDVLCQCSLTDTKLQNICTSQEKAISKKHDSRDSQEKCRCAGDTTYHKTPKLIQKPVHECSAKKTVHRRPSADSQLMCTCSSIQNGPCKEKCRCSTIGDTLHRGNVEKVKPTTNVNQQRELPPKRTVHRRISADSKLVCTCSSIPKVRSENKNVYKRCSADSQLLCLCQSIQEQLNKLKSECTGVCNKDNVKSLQIESHYNPTDGAFHQKFSGNLLPTKVEQQFRGGPNEDGVQQQRIVSARHSDSAHGSVQNIWPGANKVGVSMTSSHSVCECTSSVLDDIKSKSEKPYESAGVEENLIEPCDCHLTNITKDCHCGSNCQPVETKTSGRASKEDLKNLSRKSSGKNKSEILDRLPSIREDAAQDSSDNNIKKIICRCVPDVTESQCRCKKFIEGISNLMTAGRRSVQGDRPCECNPDGTESKCRCDVRASKTSGVSTSGQKGDALCQCLNEATSKCVCGRSETSERTLSRVQSGISGDKIGRGTGPCSCSVGKVKSTCQCSATRSCDCNPEKALSKCRCESEVGLIKSTIEKNDVHNSPTHSTTSKRSSTLPCYCSVDKIRSKCQCASTQPCDCNPEKSPSKCRCESEVGPEGTNKQDEVHSNPTHSTTSERSSTLPCYCSVDKIRSKCQCASTQPCDCNPEKAPSKCRCKSEVGLEGTNKQDEDHKSLSHSKTSERSSTLPCYCSVGKIRSKCQCGLTQPCSCNPNKVESKCRCSSKEIYSTVADAENKDALIPMKTCYCSPGKIQQECTSVVVPETEKIQSKTRSNSEINQNAKNVQNKSNGKTTKDDSSVPCRCSVDKMTSKCPCIPIPAGDYDANKTKSKKRDSSEKASNVADVNTTQSKRKDSPGKSPDGPCGCFLSKMFSKCFCKPNLTCYSTSRPTSTTDLPAQKTAVKPTVQINNADKVTLTNLTKPQSIPYNFNPDVQQKAFSLPTNFTQNYMRLLQKRKEMEMSRYAAYQSRSSLSNIIDGIQCQVRQLSRRIEDTLEFHLRSESIIKSRITQKINSLNDELMLSNKFCIEAVRNMTNSLRNDVMCFCT